MLSMSTNTFAVDIHIGRYADPTRVMGEALTILPNFNGKHDTEVDYGASQSDTDHPCAAFWFTSRNQAEKFRDALLNVKGIFSMWVGEKGIDF